MGSLKPHQQKCDSNIQLEKWSDKKCWEISLQDAFPAAVKSLQVQRRLISRFLNFYLGGKLQKGLNPRDVVFAAISIMPVSLDTEEFIWKESAYKENGSLFFLSPDDKLRIEIEDVINKKTVDVVPPKSDEDLKHSSADTSTETSNVSDDKATHEETSKNLKSSVENLLWYRNKTSLTSNKDATTIPEYGPVENAAFCISCNHLLDQWEHSESARTALKYFFAMVALVVMRCRVKTIQNVTKYFATKFFQDLVVTKIEYSIPHRGFIKKCWKAFRETDKNIQIMFAKLVIRSFLNTDTLTHYGKYNILRFAILSHTADFGLGVISMLQILANNSSNFKILFEGLYSEETAVSWYKVNDFFEMYMRKEARQVTFHWACIIETGQFKHLSCYNNYELAVVMAVFIENMTKDSGVWRASWVSSGENLETLKELGSSLYEKYTLKDMSFLLEDLGFLVSLEFD